MQTEDNIYSIHQIAALLGISVSSIERWIESGKLKCIYSSDGCTKIKTEHLLEFATMYNISMNFLENGKVKDQQSKKMFAQMSVAQ